MGALNGSRGAGMYNETAGTIRGICILLVMLHHFHLAYDLTNGVLADLLTPSGMLALVRNANYGVTAFFTISGFLITTTSQRRWGHLHNVKIGEFYLLRSARILPSQIMLIAIVVVLACTRIPAFENHSTERTIEPPSFWLAILAATTFWMNNLVIWKGWFNYCLCILWSLSVECMFYFVIPLVFRWATRLLLFTAAVSLLVGPMYRYHAFDDADALLYSYLSNADAFGAGVLVGLYQDRIASGFKRLLKFVGLAVVGATYFWGPIGREGVLGVSFMTLGVGALLLSSCDGAEDGVSRKANSFYGLLGWIGRHCYELYLFHLVVLALLITYFPPPSTSPLGKMWILSGFLVGSALISNLLGRVFSAPLNKAFRAAFRSKKTRIEEKSVFGQ
jgi:peptidoglycan/LPS O-acetylase OafA/YrhL